MEEGWGGKEGSREGGREGWRRGSGTDPQARMDHFSKLAVLYILAFLKLH